MPYPSSATDAASDQQALIQFERKLQLQVQQQLEFWLLFYLHEYCYLYYIIVVIFSLQVFVRFKVRRMSILSPYCISFRFFRSFFDFHFDYKYFLWNIFFDKFYVLPRSWPIKYVSALQNSTCCYNWRHSFSEFDFMLNSTQVIYYLSNIVSSFVRFKFNFNPFFLIQTDLQLPPFCPNWCSISASLFASSALPCKFYSGLLNCSSLLCYWERRWDNLLLDSDLSKYNFSMPYLLKDSLHYK